MCFKRVITIYKVYEKFPKYRIYDDGNITDLTGKPLKTFKNNKGYLYVNLRINGKSKIVFIHRIVAQMFCDGYEKGLQVNHINGNKTDNRALNLEWVSAKANMRHSVDVLGNFVGSKNGFAKSINVYKYGEDKLYAHYDCIATMIRELLCKQFNLKFHTAESSVYRVLSGKRKSYYGFTFKYTKIN